LLLMDDELCDTVVLGAIQLQAAFSEVVAGASSIHTERTRQRDGAHLSKGCTRGTVGLWCDLLLLRVLRIATITLAASRYSATLHARSDLYDVL
jgi:hypothetical protein